MNIKFPRFSFLLMVCLFSVPVFLKAQGNHCVVSKSAFRLSIDSGKQVYIKQCSSCHQTDGTGNSNINPPLIGKRITGDKKYLVEIIIRGTISHDSTSGKIYQGQMPANPEITDKEIADVLTYVRNSFGNRAAAIKEKEVNTIRSGQK
jgi:mono/diheme cytochrome c family protein